MQYFQISDRVNYFADKLQAIMELYKPGWLPDVPHLCHVRAAATAHGLYLHTDCQGTMEHYHPYWNKWAIIHILCSVQVDDVIHSMMCALSYIISWATLLYSDQISNLIWYRKIYWVPDIDGLYIYTCISIIRWVMNDV